jgi:hypothetical protein
MAFAGLVPQVARARRDHFGGGGGAGSEHRPLTHWSFVLQQSAAVLHASYSCEQPFGVDFPQTS